MIKVAGTNLEMANFLDLEDFSSLNYDHFS